MSTVPSETNSHPSDNNLSSIPPPADDGVETIDAASLAASDVGRSAGPLILRRRWFNDQQSTLLRLLSSTLVPTTIHNFVPSGSSKITLRCAGQPCALCLARHKPTESYLMLAYFVDDAELATVVIEKAGGAGSLRTALLPLLQRPDHDRLLVEVTREKSRHTAAVVRVLPEDEASLGEDYGLAVIRDGLARGDLKPSATLASVEHRDNQTLLADLDWLPRKIRLFHPGLELASL